ncbi:MAG: hypothetical protein A2293_12245 [Elusimicrobia bacterium RIFOXYB2_FULL_49_7]|nr:MAG: hypothetical protein A2293_12245 [Elusimicrobia bacterium RIFOXYB2_FULL_49_7]
MLVDFSDAIFVARKNLAASSHCLFFMGDIQRLPFAKDFADFIFCLGVLHHLPSPCLGEVRKLKKYAPSLLIFLYYSLDNRPFYFRFILSMVTVARRLLCTVRNETFRKMFSLAGTFFLYMPLVIMGKLLKPLGLSSNVPLYDAYHDKGVARIEQDVYDRFFTRIEQRVSRKQIKALHDTFAAVTISGYLPYHHFLCKR